MARVRLGRLHSTDAQLARLALEQESIDVELVGEPLTTLQGAIPQSEVVIELWIESEHLDRAKKVLAGALDRPATKKAEVRCPKCASTNPGHFELCWCCQADLSAAVPSAPSASAAPPQKRLPVVAIAFAISTCVLAGLLWREKQLPKAAPRGPVSAEWTTQDCLDEFIEGARITRSCDRDRDDVFEVYETFDKKGRLVTTSYDSNEDGVFERVDSVDADGRLLSRTFDLDGDWRFERVDDFDATEKLDRRGTYGSDGRSVSTEFFEEDGGLLATGTGSDVVFWKKDGREVRVVWGNNWSPLGGLTVSADGGVVRRQVLTIDGWSDVTP